MFASAEDFRIAIKQQRTVKGKKHCRVKNCFGLNWRIPCHSDNILRGRLTKRNEGNEKLDPRAYVAFNIAFKRLETWLLLVVPRTRVVRVMRI